MTTELPTASPPPFAEELDGSVGEHQGLGARTSGVDETLPFAMGWGPYGPVPPNEPTYVPADPPKGKRRRLAFVLLALFVLVTAGSLFVWFAREGSNRKRDYLVALDAAQVRSQFPDDNAAVSNAKRACADLKSGTAREGYMRDKIGVESYCPTYVDGFNVVPTPEEQATQYFADLDLENLRAQFANDAAAIANAQRVCTELKGGSAAQGYARDAAGVKVYCNSFYDQFKVVPTPEEQRAAYLAALRSAGFAGKFSSDENAVAHGMKVCTDLKAGGLQRGLPEDRIAVQVYCAEFLGGFKVLRTSKIEGSMVVRNSSPSTYYPAITASGGFCIGTYGYSDITAGTAVTVKNGAGRILAQTNLSIGSGTKTRCTFSFEVTLTEGEDQYVVEVSHRGSLSFSFTELDISGIYLTLGD